MYYLKQTIKLKVSFDTFRKWYLISVNSNDLLVTLLYRTCKPIRSNDMKYFFPSIQSNTYSHQCQNYTKDIMRFPQTEVKNSFDMNFIFFQRYCTLSFFFQMKKVNFISQNKEY